MTPDYTAGYRAGIEDAAKLVERDECDPSIRLDPKRHKNLSDWLNEQRAAAIRSLSPTAPAQEGELDPVALEAAAKAYCVAKDENPERDWRDQGGVFLSVAISPEDAPRWKHERQKIGAAIRAYLAARQGKDG